jgi:hypothetical protein
MNRTNMTTQTAMSADVMVLDVRVIDVAVPSFECWHQRVFEQPTATPRTSCYRALRDQRDCSGRDAERSGCVLSHGTKPTLRRPKQVPERIGRLPAGSRRG